MVKQQNVEAVYIHTRKFIGKCKGKKAFVCDILGRLFLS